VSKNSWLFAYLKGRVVDDVRRMAVAPSLIMTRKTWIEVSANDINSVANPNVHLFWHHYR
jgi:hypothetical protein